MSSPPSSSSRQFLIWTALGIILATAVGLLVTRGTPGGQSTAGAPPVAPGRAPQALAQRTADRDDAAPSPAAAEQKRPPPPTRGRAQPWSVRGPKLTKVAAAPAAPSFETLYAEHYPLASTWSSLSARNIAESGPLFGRCASALKERNPVEATGGRVEGSVAITFEVNGGVARVTRIRQHKEGDEEFASCFGAAMPWARGPFEVKGEKDGVYETEWPYRFGVR